MNVTHNGKSKHYRTVWFDKARNRVRLIEQRMLPHQFKIVSTTDYVETARAITDMIVRGAGAIGATAAYGLAQGARAFQGRGVKSFEKHLAKVHRTLADARPTAVDPVNAKRWMRANINAITVAERQRQALALAEQFAEDDAAHCQALGQAGEPLIPDGARVLTHYNAGWLAFVDHGSATAPIYAAQAKGKSLRVLRRDTASLTGAILTAWELAQQGIPHDIIADNAAGHLMQRAKSTSSSSAVTARRPTGEVANKIGTYTKAVLAKRHATRSSPSRSRRSTGDSSPDWTSQSRNATRTKCFALGASRRGPEAVRARGQPRQHRTQPVLRRHATRVDHGHHHAAGHLQAPPSLEKPGKLGFTGAA